MATATKKAPAKKTTAKKADGYSVFEAGGKQYKVSVGDILNIEKVIDAEEGKSVSFDKVVLTDDGKSVKVGTPHVSGAKVEAEVIGNGRAKKVDVIKYKAKSRYFKKRGHRQPFTKIKVTKI
jgi:large subunit ribosomal protein L21